jgi:uncharacterized membrane protein YeiH
MNNSPLLISDLINFVICIVLALSCLYAAWVNQIQKQISKVGFDAFILALYEIFDKRKAMMIRENPQLIWRMGMLTLVVGLSSLYATMEIFIEKIWPHVR